MMESFYLRNKMDFKDNAIEINLGTCWSPVNEDDSFDAIVFKGQGIDVSTITENGIENRRQLATQLLEELDSTHNQDEEPYCNWLEEPMDLDVFGQSLIESSTAQLDEASVLPLSPGPSSPLASQPPTPIQPASPLDLYSSPEDFYSNKQSEEAIEVPAENEELLESLELLLEEITDSAPESNQGALQDDEDITTALLDSLIKGHVDESQVIDQLAEFSAALMNTAELELAISSPPIEQVLPVFITPVLNTIPEPRSVTERKTTPGHRRNSSAIQPTQATIRKPRKRSLKADDRRLRKKEQNKTAATRYRIKKKVELDILLEEESDLEQRNRQLQLQHDELANEVRYLKKLMREVFVNRAGNRR